MTFTRDTIDKTNNPTLPNRSPALGISRRGVALTAGISLLLMAVLAPIAHFGVLQNFVVSGDAAATIGNIVADEGLFRLAIATLLVVSFLDIVVAWALYVLLKPVNEALAVLVGWLRLAAPAVFAVALANLLDVANLAGNPASSTLQPDQLGAQVMASIASFDNGWDMSLAIFGLHLVGLGYLLFKSVDFPKFLGVLVVVAGGGYIADTFARILIPDFEFTFSLITFVGEALLIFWLLWRSIKGFPSQTESRVGELTERRLAQPGTMAP
ncbi:MAG TPA: DUF4386 domain-containing protein [Acidimicrobiia bacterium]|nr:DUF4386 domain-containing protein [Acidimicrobiia bacterium]